MEKKLPLTWYRRPSTWNPRPSILDPRQKDRLHLTRPVIMQIRKMADYNLLLVAIPEDTRKSEPINQKNKLKTLL